MTPEPNWLKLPVQLAGLLAFALLMAPLFQSFEALRSATVDFAKAGPRAAWVAASAHAGTPAMSLLAFVVGYIGILNLFWLYNDRYYLALLPPVITLVLARIPAPRAAPRLAWVVIGVFAAAALVGSRDAYRFNLAVRHAWETLVRAGVAPSEIDAGYAWNGWVLYAHADHLPEGLTPDRDVPWISSSREPTYVLSKTPKQGYRVERTIGWADLPWPGPDRLLVLRRQSATDAQ
jgi:hypothetical protein